MIALATALACSDARPAAPRPPAGEPGGVRNTVVEPAPPPPAAAPEKPAAREDEAAPQAGAQAWSDALLVVAPTLGAEGSAALNAALQARTRAREAEAEAIRAAWYPVLATSFDHAGAPVAEAAFARLRSLESGTMEAELAFTRAFLDRAGVEGRKRLQATGALDAILVDPPSELADSLKEYFDASTAGHAVPPETLEVAYALRYRLTPATYEVDVALRELRKQVRAFDPGVASAPALDGLARAFRVVLALQEAKFAELAWMEGRLGSPIGAKLRPLGTLHSYLPRLVLPGSAASGSRLTDALLRDANVQPAVVEQAPANPAVEGRVPEPASAPRQPPGAAGG
jgi:hypothetical protein